MSHYLIGLADGGEPMLSQGSTGEAVRQLQNLLGISVDGKFGPATKAAVVTFQRAHGLAADGVVGPLTWQALIPVAPSPAPAPSGREPNELANDAPASTPIVLPTPPAPSSAPPASRPSAPPASRPSVPPASRPSAPSGVIPVLQAVTKASTSGGHGWLYLGIALVAASVGGVWLIRRHQESTSRAALPRPRNKRMRLELRR